MDASRFDTLTRLLSRRQTLATLTGLGLASWLNQEDVTARKHHKHKTKLKRNPFGCVNVGKTCRKNGDCCSNLCTGTTTKTCQAHDTGGCMADHPSGEQEVPCPENAARDCFRTTGNAGYCGRFPSCGGIRCTTTFDCQGCTTDAECQAFCHDPAAACIVRNCGGFGPTACVTLNGCTP